jgi:hypothetical protein
VFRGKWGLETSREKSKRAVTIHLIIHGAEKLPIREWLYVGWPAGPPVLVDSVIRTGCDLVEYDEMSAGGFSHRSRALLLCLTKRDVRLCVYWS